MTKQVVAIGSRTNGKMTIIYTGHAVALWSSLNARWNGRVWRMQR